VFYGFDVKMVIALGSGQANYLKPLEISEKHAAIYPYIELFIGKKSIIKVINVERYSL